MAAFLVSQAATMVSLLARRDPIKVFEPSIEVFDQARWG
jgi:hypothetical protein